MPDKYFFDSNLWIYLFIKSTDPKDILKREKLQSIISMGLDASVSAQVLNEVANVLMKKYSFDEKQTATILQSICQYAFVCPLTESLSLNALLIKSSYKISWFDSLIAAAAIESGCNFLYSEDLHDGLVIDKKLTVVNPFNLP